MKEGKQKTEPCREKDRIEDAAHPSKGWENTPAPSSIESFQRLYGNRATLRFFQRYATSRPHLSSIQPKVQRSPREGAPEPAAAPETSTEESHAPGLIVDDSASDLLPGQMRKSEFLSRLRADVRGVARAALPAVVWASVGSPRLDRWLGSYQDRDGPSVERAVRRYAPESRGVASAEDYISSIRERVRKSLETWTFTGEFPGVSESGPESGGGFLSRVGDIIGGIGAILFKAHADGPKHPLDPRAVQRRLDPGRPLDSGIRSRMGAVLGRDLSHVNVHTRSNDADLSHGLNARAFTIGNDIVFGRGEYRPGTLVGDALIAHELAHTVQQGSEASPPGNDIRESASLEKEADLSAANVVASLWGGASKAVAISRSGLRLRRCRDCSRSEPTVRAWTTDEWSENVAELRALAETGSIDENQERRFVEAINQALGGSAPPPIQLPVTKFTGAYDVDDAHVYFDKRFRDKVAKTSCICRFGPAKGLSSRCDAENFVGAAIIMGPLSIQETPEYTRSLIRHEHVHLMEHHAKRDKGIARPRICNSEMLAYGNQFYYINALSDDELKGTVNSYLTYYIKADADYRRKADERIASHVSARLPPGPRTKSDVRTVLTTVRTNVTSGALPIPRAKRAVALEGLRAIVDAVEETP